MIQKRFVVQKIIYNEQLNDPDFMFSLRQQADIDANGKEFIKMISGQDRENFENNQVTIHFIYADNSNVQ